jgi:ATP synthase protein I
MGRFSRLAQQLRPVQSGAPLSRPPLERIYGAQLAILLTIAAVLLAVDNITAYSALMGGLISIGPCYFFARQVFRFRGARLAPQITQAFYAGEAGKFLLTAVAFAVVFATVKPLHAGILLLAYLGMTVCHWASSAWIATRGGRR